MFVTTALIGHSPSAVQTAEGTIVITRGRTMQRLFMIPSQRCRSGLPRLRGIPCDGVLAFSLFQKFRQHGLVIVQELFRDGIMFGIRVLDLPNSIIRKGIYDGLRVRHQNR